MNSYYVHIKIYDKVYTEFNIEGVLSCGTYDLDDAEFTERVKEFIVKKALTVKHCFIETTDDISHYTIVSITKL